MQSDEIGFSNDDLQLDLLLLKESKLEHKTNKKKNKRGQKTMYWAVTIMLSISLDNKPWSPIFDFAPYQEQPGVVLLQEHNAFCAPKGDIQKWKKLFFSNALFQAKSIGAFGWKYRKEIFTYLLFWEGFLRLRWPSVSLKNIIKCDNTWFCEWKEETGEKY